MDYIRSENLGRSTPMSSIWRPTQRISDVYATARHKNNSLEHLWADTLACTRSSLPQRGSTARPAQVSRAGTTRGTCPSRRSAWVRVCAVGVLKASCTVEIDAAQPAACHDVATAATPRTAAKRAKSELTMEARLSLADEPTLSGA